MAKLSEDLEKKISDILDDINNLYNEKKYTESLKNLYKAWEILPEPKYCYDESYSIVWEILNIAIIIKDRGVLTEWLDKIFLADPERVDSGEREMWAGRVYYALENKEKAYNYFKVANMKSRGRCFWPTDKIYKDFYLSYANKEE